ncbi:hypothetical protein [Streptomyces sp. NPDC088736]|uniref:hypothetical protein n=1 Tax=Streptomyces sp. NPDC088736 TaxID=3365881 RepID=UPI00382C1E39
MPASRSRASETLRARIEATTKGQSYQWAEIWLERNPDATAKELLLFLAELAERARREAIEAEMASGGLDELEAAQLVDRYMDYRDVINKEMDEA